MILIYFVPMKYLKLSGMISWENTLMPSSRTMWRPLTLKTQICVKLPAPRLPLRPTVTLLASNPTWYLSGIRLNVNGLNNPPLGFFQDLFSQFTLVAIQETKFSSSNAVRRVTHFSKVCDLKSISFWSHPTTPEFSVTRGRDGVGLLLSGKHPFQTVTNVTHQYVTFSSSTLLSHRYLVIKARTDDINLCIHVVYAPVQVADRKDFFNALPARFPDDCHHLVMGDFNVPMEPTLDEVIPYMHDLGPAEFIAWQLRLGITDAWRNWWPDKREFTGPGRKNRVDYVFLSPTLLSYYLVGISHAVPSGRPPTCYIYNQFSKPSSHCTPSLEIPRWILQKPYVQRVLEYTLDQLCERMRCDERYNCGGLFDEHKREDSIFLRQMVLEFKNHELENHRYLRQRLYDA
ncbi:hypothetical protein PsorP6_000776 [Peronosclerospora sorghi]|uniref:Uncharacterized protein n=1 Tax=Peronosclerospora sorghi TaxID=230839 RepID=A0ACC0WRS6_9STRA|nr:hypothetical protein PsorP6_000776 [Peronosclerospora sorghi]